MRFKGTWILLILAVIVAGYFFLIEQPRHRHKMDEDRLEQEFTSVQLDDVYGFIIERPDVTLSFTRQNDGWMMNEPITDMADAGPVNTAIQSLADATVERKIATGTIVLSDLGLEEPAALVRLESSSGVDTLVVRIGDHTLGKFHCYALRPGDADVLLLPAQVRRYVLRDLFDFRNKKVIDFAVADVEKLRILRGERPVLWEKDALGGWIAHANGDTISGDPAEIEGVLRTIRGLRARSFLPQVAASGSETPDMASGSISFWLSPDNSGTTLLFGEDNGGVCYVKRIGEERTAVIDPGIFTVFKKTYFDFRDRRLLHFDRSAAAKIRVEFPDTSSTIIKSGTEWVFPNPTLGSIDQAAVGRFLSRLQDLEFTQVLAERLQDDGRYGFSGPRSRITVHDADDQVIDRALIGRGAPGDGGSYATSISSKLLAVMPDSVIAAVRNGLGGLRRE
jgi:hypothetical protein